MKRSTTSLITILSLIIIALVAFPTFASSGTHYEGTPRSETGHPFLHVDNAWDTNIAEENTGNEAASQLPITRLNPVNGTAIDSTWEWPPFTFQDNGAQWYQVWIGLSDYSKQAVYKWYPARSTSAGNNTGSGICANGICTLPYADNVRIQSAGNGTFQWWMTSWSPAQPNYNANWDMTTFQILVPPPPTNVSTHPDNGDIVIAPPAEIFWWNNDAYDNVFWFRAWFGPSDYSETFFFAWISSQDTNYCEEEYCSIPTAGMNFINGKDYELWLEIWGPGGYVTWFDMVTAPLPPLKFKYDTTFEPS